MERWGTAALWFVWPEAYPTAIPMEAVRAAINLRDAAAHVAWMLPGQHPAFSNFLGVIREGLLRLGACRCSVALAEIATRRSVTASLASVILVIGELI